MEPPYVDSIEWAKWHVFWVDERVVPKDHDDSNYKLAYDGFLSQVHYLKLLLFALISYWFLLFLLLNRY